MTDKKTLGSAANDYAQAVLLLERFHAGQNKIQVEVRGVEYPVTTVIARALESYLPQVLSATEEKLQHDIAITKQALQEAELEAAKPKLRTV